MSEPRVVADLPTPSLVVELDVFERNLATMSAVLPGGRLRPHMKAAKSTAVAQRLAQAGHTAFCCATVAEVEGMARAGLGDDLLLANEVADYTRLGALVADGARVTVAIDSDATLEAAVRGGVRDVLIDVNIGLPRCGCAPSDAGRLADAARAGGLNVRGVMGYEGHLMHMDDRIDQAARVAESLEVLAQAHADVGGDIISAGGTGSFDINRVATEIQAGSYLFMDMQYATMELPFDEALHVHATIISVTPGQWAVADAGLKAFGMDQGNPALAHGEPGDVLYCSDEHTTLVHGTWNVGDRVRLRVPHVDPTIARHERMWVADGDTIVDEWPIDLRHW